MEWLTDPGAWIALATLTLLEVVLGIDNIVFLTIMAGKLPEAQRGVARRVGLLLAMGMRILLLLGIAWIVRLTSPLFTVFDNGISGRDLILIAGGLFLLAKSTHEIHHRLEGSVGEKSARAIPTLAGVLLQIAILDLVFSLDSVITAVGMVKQVPVMVTAVVLAVLLMMVLQ